MKIDIEKLKAEYETKIQEAAMANELLDKIGDENLKVSVIGKSQTQKGKTHVSIRHEEILKKLSIQQVGLILCKLESTEKSDVYIGSNKYEEMDYELKTARSYQDRYATLKIAYIYNNLDVNIELPIEPNSELNGFFADTCRKVEDHEIRIHYIVSRPNREASDVTVPVKVFANGEYVKFAGGHVTCKSECAANNIIEAIKDVYLKTIEQNEK